MSSKNLDNLLGMDKDPVMKRVRNIFFGAIGTLAAAAGYLGYDSYQGFVAERGARLAQIDPIETQARDVAALNKYTNDTLEVSNLLRIAEAKKTNLVFSAKSNFLWIFNTSDFTFNDDLESYRRTVQLAGRTVLDKITKFPNSKPFGEPDERFDRRFSPRLPRVLIPGQLNRSMDFRQHDMGRRQYDTSKSGAFGKPDVLVKSRVYKPKAPLLPRIVR